MTYEVWLNEVKEALASINMPMDEWQGIWPFDFSGEHDAGTSPDGAAMKANRFWWYRQNRSMGRGCDRLPGCWLPRDHQGECQPMYEPGDYVKVEFEGAMPGEWMWVVVQRREDARRLVYGRLDNEPLNDYAGKVKLGSQLAVSYTQIREFKTPAEFKVKD